jgi:hypothetical protein
MRRSADTGAKSGPVERVKKHTKEEKKRKEKKRKYTVKKSSQCA